MYTPKEFFFIFLWIAALAFLIFMLGCDTLQNVDDIAKISRKLDPIVETGKEVADDIRSADGVRDWAGIIEKIAYGVGAAAAVAGGVVVNKKRKAKKA